MHTLTYTPAVQKPCWGIRMLHDARGTARREEMPGVEEPAFSHYPRYTAPANK